MTRCETSKKGELVQKVQQRVNILWCYFGGAKEAYAVFLILYLATSDAWHIPVFLLQAFDAPHPRVGTKLEKLLRFNQQVRRYRFHAPACHTRWGPILTHLNKQALHNER